MTNILVATAAVDPDYRGRALRVFTNCLLRLREQADACKKAGDANFANIGKDDLQGAAQRIARTRQELGAWSDSVRELPDNIFVKDKPVIDAVLDIGMVTEAIGLLGRDNGLPLIGDAGPPFEQGGPAIQMKNALVTFAEIGCALIQVPNARAAAVIQRYFEAFDCYFAFLHYLSTHRANRLVRVGPYTVADGLRQGVIQRPTIVLAEEQRDLFAVEVWEAVKAVCVNWTDGQEPMVLARIPRTPIVLYLDSNGSKPYVSAIEPEPT